MTVKFKRSHYRRAMVLYRDLEGIMADRSVKVDHATLNRRVGKYSPMIAKSAQQSNVATGRSWRLDETDGVPSRIVIDKSGANFAGS